MPLPPPPAAALMITGYPISAPIFLLRYASSLRGPFEPGTVGTPAAIMVLIAATLSPIVRITEAVGPININPLFSTRSAKSAFSARNP